MLTVFIFYTSNSLASERHPGIPLHYRNIRVISPQHDPDEGWSEAEVLGAMLWLWERHPAYQGVALDTAMAHLLPVIRSRSFSLFVKDAQPYGYVNWCWLNEHEAQKYVNKEEPYTYFLDKQNNDKNQQLWMLQVFFPEGLGHDARWIFRNLLFKESGFRFVYHRSKEVPRVITFTKIDSSLESQHKEQQ